ncbi:MAG: Peroxisomal membrane protein pex16 [Vezdaea aestivalis]|nr:MAG: Peroxisomal membrane protein pex16 [Vezdaea aestivalis]
MDVIKDFSFNITDILSLPPKLLDQYGDFVTTNASSVSQIESALRSLTYIIPGRFRDAEIASESIHASIQLLSLYHSSVLTRHLSTPSNPTPALPTPHNRYTHHMRQTSPLYARLSVFVQTLRYTELLLEMGAKRRGGDKARWRAVVLIEALKAVCRLCMLRATEGRPLVNPPLPECMVVKESADREAEEEEMEESLDEGVGMESERVGSIHSGFRMPRTKLVLAALPNSGSLHAYLMSRVLTADDVRPAPALLGRLANSSQMVAEVLFIIRPLLYALALQRWQRNKKSWMPWIIGLGVEYAARELQKSGNGGARLGGLEREEQKARGGMLGWWMLRSGFYEGITKPWVKSVTGKMKGKFGLDLIGGVIDDYEWLWSEYYFSTTSL